MPGEAQKTACVRWKAVSSKAQPSGAEEVSACVAQVSGPLGTLLAFHMGLSSTCSLCAPLQQAPGQSCLPR